MLHYAAVIIRLTGIGALTHIHRSLVLSEFNFNWLAATHCPISPTTFVKCQCKVSISVSQVLQSRNKWHPHQRMNVDKHCHTNAMPES